jgi:DNA-directed RNA polymerase specialized sigma24 family protein
LKKSWVPGSTAFRRLLSWLDGDNDSDGERYLEMRRRLVAYFDRKHCLFPDELADESLNRVARRLEEQGAITDAAPAKYCYIVARFVFLEYLRGPERGHASLTTTPDAHEFSATDPAARPGAADDAAAHEARLDCLDRCLQQLPADDRALILEYYRGEAGAKIARRRELAARFALTANALTIRACRIRAKLEACVAACSREVT